MTGPREEKHRIHVLGKENRDIKLMARERLGRSCQGVTTAPSVLAGKGKTSDTARAGKGSVDRAGAQLGRAAGGATSLLAPGGLVAGLVATPRKVHPFLEQLPGGC